MPSTQRIFGSPRVLRIVEGETVLCSEIIVVIFGSVNIMFTSCLRFINSDAVQITETLVFFVGIEDDGDDDATPRSSSPDEADDKVSSIHFPKVKFNEEDS